MKILVNTNSLAPPLTGIGHYTLNLLRVLLHHPEVSEIVGLGAAGLLSQPTLQRLLEQQARHNDHSAAPGDSERRLRRLLAALPAARWLRRKQRHFQAWYHSRQLQGFIYWEPNYLLLPFAGPAVATLHDLSHLRMPEHHPAARVAEMNRQLPRTLARATRLIAVSAFTREEIIARLHPAQPIDIVPPAVDPSFFAVQAEARAQAKRRYHLPDAFILSVATLEPRKNLARLVQAFAALPEGLRERYPLVLAGSRGWHTSELENSLRPLVATGHIRVLGYVEQNHLPALYSSATVLAYVSLYEGFGMPIAEAMAAGTPVLTAATSAMPEVAAGHALLVDPYDTQAIQQQLQRLLSDSTLRHQLAQSARRHATTFDWSLSADRLLESLRAAQQEYHR